jgi:hypothetical protein
MQILIPFLFNLFFPKCFIIMYNLANHSDQEDLTRPDPAGLGIDDKKVLSDRNHFKVSSLSNHLVRVYHFFRRTR